MSAAADSWADQPLLQGSLAVSITYYFVVDRLDVDNIPKPIMDALKGVVFDDDLAVTDLLCRKRPVNQTSRIPTLHADLSRYLEQGAPAVFIRVLAADSEEVTTW